MVKKKTDKLSAKDAILTAMKRDNALNGTDKFTTAEVQDLVAELTTGGSPIRPHAVVQSLTYLKQQGLVVNLNERVPGTGKKYFTLFVIAERNSMQYVPHSSKLESSPATSTVVVTANSVMEKLQEIERRLPNAFEATDAIQDSYRQGVKDGIQMAKDLGL